MRATPRALILGVIALAGALVTLARVPSGPPELAWIGGLALYTLYLHREREHMAMSLALGSALAIALAEARGAALVVGSLGAALVVDTTLARVRMQFVESGVGEARPRIFVPKKKHQDAAERAPARTLRALHAGAWIVASGLHLWLRGPAWTKGMLEVAPLVSIGALICVYIARLLETRFTLGGASRIAAHAVFGGVAALVASSLADAAGAERSAELAVALAAFGIGAAVTSSWSELGCARSLRTLGALACTVAPPVGVAFMLALGGVLRDARLAVVVTLFALTAGSATRRVAEKFLPEAGRLRAALRKARQAVEREPSVDTFRGVLEALAVSEGIVFSAPSLLRAEPACVHDVDRAGYERVRNVPWPALVFDLAAREPYGLLRREVLEGVAVRRADVRPALAWMDRESVAIALAIGIDAAELSAEAHGVPPGGLLTFTDDGYTDFSLEEAEEARDLARALRACIDARGAIERAHRHREESVARVAVVETQLERAREARERAEGRVRAMAGSIARLDPSAASASRSAERAAFDAALQSRFAATSAVVVTRPPGGAVLTSIAHAHLGSSRAPGPLVIVDCTTEEAHALATWADVARSPLTAAHGGRLVLCDPHALPEDIIEHVAAALAERRAPGEPEALDASIVIVTSGAPSAESPLALRFAQAFATPLAFPTLADRVHDLGTMLRAALAREATRQKGHAVGITDDALALVIEHAFLGNDAELAAFVVRAVHAARGDMVELDDARAALGQSAAADAPAPVLREVPSPVSKRGRGRKK